jgi:hypothetical protein
MWSNQYWAKTYWAGVYWTPALKIQSVPVSGSGTPVTKKRTTGWIRERELLSLSLKQIHDQELQKIGQNLIRSEQPQVKKVVKKLIDYAGDVEKSKSLDLEIKRLERFLQKKKIFEDLEKEKQRELRDALSTLKDILKEDMEILEMYLDIEKNETIELLCVIGVII